VKAFRFATLFGLSPRMRFDIAVNGIALSVVQTGRCRVLRDGTQWRPFLHVADAARAFMAGAAAAPEVVSGKVFNAGGDGLNLQLLDLSKAVASAAGAAWDVEWYGDPDNRSYRVSFGRIAAALGYRPTLSVEAGAREIVAALRSGALTAGDECFTVRWYKQLISRGLVLR
jgi:nucleoside-diphosphate-sugar epimerase